MRHFGKLISEGISQPITQQAAAHMKMRQEQNRSKGLTAAEKWMRQRLEANGLYLTEQAIWGTRIFDFWCSERGCAIEVDGPEHDSAVDQQKDLYMLVRSAIVVLRVRNFNEDDATSAITKLKALAPWKIRRETSSTVPQLLACSGKQRKLLAAKFIREATGR